MLIIKILSGIALAGSVDWFITQRGYEPALSIVTSLCAFIAACLGEKKMKRQANQNQSVAKNGIGIQAGGDVTTGSILVDRKTTDAE
jgi:hypothetical protein